jgi:hypothetical protein
MNPKHLFSILALLLPIPGSRAANAGTTTGGTGKYEGTSGGGTYFYENLTDTLAGGTYKGKFELP